MARRFMVAAVFRFMQLTMLVLTALTLMSLQGQQEPGSVYSIPADSPIAPEAFPFIPLVLSSLVALGWVAVWMASRSLRRDRSRREAVDEPETEDIVRRAFEDYRRCLTEPTREYESVDARGLREIHGRTAPELVAESRAESWKWSRTVQALACDADFRAIATRLESQFPQT